MKKDGGRVIDDHYAGLIARFLEVVRSFRGIGQNMFLPSAEDVSQRRCTLYRYVIKETSLLKVRQNVLPRVQFRFNLTNWS